MKIQELQNIAIKAAIAGGSQIMQIYEGEIEIEYKEDNSPLTIADKRANDVIISFLNETQIPIISEENKQVDYNIRNSWRHCWVVDPLDGTKEFIKQNGEFTVNIALLEDGNPVLGIIYVPATKTLYFGNTSLEKSFKIELEQHQFNEDIFDKAVSLNPKNIDSQTIRVVGSRSHMSQETLDFIETLKKEYQQVEIVSKGSSLKFCLVAEGLADVYPRFAPTMEWDTAAGQAICNAVGINVISKATDKPLAYNKENLLNPWFIVG